MKMANKRILFSLMFSFLIIQITSFEDKESTQRRLNFYKKISAYSNNKISVGVSADRGLSCIANDYIEFGSKIMKVPKRMSLSPFYLFPFKFEFASFLMEIPGMKETLQNEHKFSVYLLTYYTLYYMYAPREEIKKYIRERKLEQYYNCEEVDESLKDSFPKIMLNSATLNDEHYQLLKKLGYPIDKGAELDAVFRWVNQKVYNSEHMEVMFPWTSNFQQFKWAYSIVMSRGMTMRVSEYLILEDFKHNQSKLDVWAKRNIELNKQFSPGNVGAPAVIAFIDLCNHYQPKFIDLRDKKPIILDTEPGYFLNTVGSTFQSGDELTYTYVNDPSNGVLFLHYGFVIPSNIFNQLRMKVQDDSQLTLAQFNLCKELGCVDPQIKDPSKVPKEKFNIIRLTNLDQNTINYARVKYLKGNFDQKQTLKTLINENPISYDNEVSAWLFYYNTCLVMIKDPTFNYKKSIYHTQKFRNICNAIEKDWKDEEMQRNDWLKNKSFENIYLTDVSYKKVIYRHLKGSINQVIYNAKRELESIKAKYLF